MFNNRLGIVVIAAMLIGGCSTMSDPGNALSDGYQVGDLTREALRIQARFCVTGDPLERLILLEVFEKVGIDVDSKSVCEIDIIEELSKL